MRVRVFLYQSLRIVFCLAFMCWAVPHCAFAAEAQKAPVARKAPVAKKQPAAKPKVQPRQSTAHLTSIEASEPKTTAPPKAAPAAARKKSGAASRPAAAKPAPASAEAKLQAALDVFAKDCVARMNKQRLPGIAQKEVKRQSDGSFLARYLAVDPDSLETSYNPTTGHKTIKYIGRMDYHEVEYVSIGKSQKQALAGPFSETNRVPITELIKYKNNKWSY